MLRTRLEMNRLSNEAGSEGFCSLFSPFPPSILCSPQFSPIFYHPFSLTLFLVFVKSLHFPPLPLFCLKNNGRARVETWFLSPCDRCEWVHRQPHREPASRPRLPRPRHSKRRSQSRADKRILQVVASRRPIRAGGRARYVKGRLL